MAIDRGDEWLGVAPDFPEHFGHAAGIFLIFRCRLAADGLQELQVHARAESGSGSGEDDHTSSGFFQLIERGKQFSDHLHGNRVALFWTIQSDGGNVFGASEKKRLVCHGRLTPRYAPWFYKRGEKAMPKKPYVRLNLRQGFPPRWQRANARIWL